MTDIETLLRAIQQFLLTVWRILCQLFHELTGLLFLVLAAVGLTLPGLTRIQPWLVSAAAAGVMIVMVFATIFHLMRGEVSSAIMTAVLLAVATFVAYQRWRVAPIRPRRVA